MYLKQRWYIYTIIFCNMFHDVSTYNHSDVLKLKQSFSTMLTFITYKYDDIIVLSIFIVTWTYNYDDFDLPIHIYMYNEFDFRL